MNDDIYAECLVKRKDSKLGILFYLAAGILILICLILLTRTSWATVGIVAVVIGIMFGKKFLKVEYEYVFVTNELAIDRIYSQESRKTVRHVEMSKIEYVEPTEPGKNSTALEQKGVTLLDYSSGEKDAKTYTVSFADKDGRFLMLIEPNEKLLRALWRCAPSKVHIAK